MLGGGSNALGCQLAAAARVAMLAAVAISIIVNKYIHAWSIDNRLMNQVPLGSLGMSIITHRHTYASVNR